MSKYQLSNTLKKTSIFLVNCKQKIDKQIKFDENIKK